MKNVTITLEEEVARCVRVWAAEHDQSVSRYVGDLLKSHMQGERRYRQAMSSFLSRGPRQLKSDGRYPPRDELHDRSLLR